MDRRVIDYSLDGYCRDIKVEIILSAKVKISESDINKALLLTMNYLFENMEIMEIEVESAD